MLKDCNYKDMEEIYTYLLINNFEVAGTHSHLARLHALTGQVAESQKHLQLAWEKRDFAKKFVPPRILFLQILFAMVEGDNTAGYIRAIVKALAVSGSTEEWTIEPVIDKYKEVLPPGDLEFVNRLSEVLSGRESVETMNGLPGWTNSAS
jgi:hypothetical protein